MSWAPKPLGAILLPSGQLRAGTRDLPVLSITMKNGLVDQADKFKKRVASSDTASYRVVRKHELVVGFPIDEGVLGFQEKYTAGIVSPAYDIWKLAHPEESHIPFLERYLRSDQARHMYASRMQGAVARRRSLPKGEFLKLEIPFPPLDDQIRIAQLLGKVEGLIAQRKQHLQQLDALLKSVFLEMFGDPILNPHGFEVRKLSEFYVNSDEGTKCGPFGSALKKDELVDAGVPVWNMDNIGSDGRMVLPFRMWITPAKYAQLSAYAVQDGDIIISRAGTVGKMCIAMTGGQPAIISTNLIRLRLGSDLRPLHFVSLMLYCKGRVGRLKTGADGSFTHMNTGVLDSLEFPYPPVGLQDQFAAFASRTELLKSYYQQSLADLETLYAALSQSAFNGELDLSRIPLPGAALHPEPIEDGTAMVVDLHVPAPAFAFPDVGPDVDGLRNETALKTLLDAWLPLWCAQLGDAAFSMDEFTAAAQSRLDKLYPDGEIELGSAAQELVKAWVFKALAEGTLSQTYDASSKRVQLKAAQA